MPSSRAPHDTLFVPTAADGLRRGPLPGVMIMGGALALIIASCLPWHSIWQTIRTPMGVERWSSTVLDTEGTLMLLLGTVVLIAGLTLVKRPTQAARLLAGMGSVVAAGIGGTYVREVMQEATAPKFIPLGYSAPVYAFGVGLYLVGFGIVLIIAGAALQRPA